MPSIKIKINASELFKRSKSLLEAHDFKVKIIDGFKKLEMQLPTSVSADVVRVEIIDSILNIGVLYATHEFIGIPLNEKSIGNTFTEYDGSFTLNFTKEIFKAFQAHNYKHLQHIEFVKKLSDVGNTRRWEVKLHSKEFVNVPIRLIIGFTQRSSTVLEVDLNLIEFNHKNKTKY